MNNKYSWFQNHAEELSYTVVHTEGETETIIASTDTAEKAHIISTALNYFNIEDYEKFLAENKS